MPDKIFISYRREDSAADARSICERLEREFGPDSVFIDIDMHAGAKFPTVLEESLAQCKVMLVLIGPSWLNAQDEQGQRRLENPDDWVRLEIVRALKRDITVIPVLVNGAKLPKQIDLPEDIWGLRDRQAASVTHDGFRYAMDGLVGDIRVAVGLAKHGGPQAVEMHSQSGTSDAKPPVNITGNNNVLSIGQLGGQTAHTIINQLRPPRTIPDAAATMLVRALTPPSDRKPKITIDCANDVDATRYADQWEAVLRRAAWDVTTGAALISAPPIVGVHIAVKSADTQGAAQLQQAFSMIGEQAPGEIDETLSAGEIRLKIGVRE